MGNFDLDLVDRVTGINEVDVEVASDLNNAVNRIVKEANYQLVDEHAIEYGKAWSILSSQVPGAEYR